MSSALLFLYAESPVHAGGPESTGGVDLPIQREQPTGLPVIWGQSLKGALRQYLQPWDDVDKAFGDTPKSPKPQPGAIVVGDARLVAFPVPTLQHTFAWATCRLALSRVARLASLASHATPSPPSVGPDRVVPADDDWGGKVVAGSYVLDAEPKSDDLAEWAEWIAERANPAPGDAAFDYFFCKLRQDLLLVPDDVLTDLTRECAELSPRVQLKLENKTVEQLFYEEHLPTETLLVSLLTAADPKADPKAEPLLRDLIAQLDGKLLVLGGDETVGKGLLWCRCHAEGGTPAGEAEHAAA